MITCRYILCSFDDLYRVKNDKADPFNDPLKRLKLKTLASDGVIKSNVKIFSWDI